MLIRYHSDTASQPLKWGRAADGVTMSSLDVTLQLGKVLRERGPDDVTIYPQILVDETIAHPTGHMRRERREISIWPLR